MKFTEFLESSFGLDGNGNFAFSKTNDGIKTSFGKTKNLKPFSKKVEGTDIQSYSLYNSKGFSDIVKSIKASSKSEDYKKFITRSAIYAERVIRSLGIDLIVVPKSSSTLNNDFSDELSKRLYVEVIQDAFIKNPVITDISIDVNHPKITQVIIDSMQKTIERGLKRGVLTVKMFHPQHRKFIKNLFTASDEKIYEKISGKNILIIDDVMTSGTTASNIADKLFENSAENVTVLTLFKS